MLKVSLDHIIPLTEARARLSELIEKTTGGRQLSGPTGASRMVQRPVRPVASCLR